VSDELGDGDARALVELLDELLGDLEHAVSELELLMAGLASINPDGSQDRLSDEQVTALAYQLMRVAEAGALVLRRYANDPQL
jgi:hypothetical protein